MNERNILVVAHAGRDDTVAAARRVIELLRGAGARPVLAPDDRAELSAVDADFSDVAALGEDIDVDDLELAIVLGGDGTILRAAELVRSTNSAPVLGINMGHVGFLAEIERDAMDDAVQRVIARDYAVEERLALAVRVKDAAGQVVFETWALNEATVEKASRERMIEVVVEIDGRPLSSYGCDGMVISTPTGSTAYNFSAGGPVIWPSVEAITVIPLSAHALFARSLVVSPDASVAIEMLERTSGTGILWCDGRRSHELPPGARVVARRSSRPVRLARLHPTAFTDRLVRKFQLPVAGWRGQDGGNAGVIEEMRMQGLGVIADAVLPLGPGFTAITGETGAGKTMVVTGLGLLLGQRADSGAVRAGAAQASVAGVWIVPESGAVADIVTDAGGDLEPLDGGQGELYVSRTLSAEGRSRASVGGRAAPAGVLSALADELVVVHGQSEQLRLRSTVAQRDALDRFGGAPIADALATYTTAFARWRELDAEIAEISENRDRRAEEAQRLREALALIEATAPEAGEDVVLAERSERLSNSEELRLAASLAHNALSSEEGESDASALVAEARRNLERAADPALSEISEGIADVGFRIADLAGQLSVYLADLDETGPHELAAVEERRAALTTLIRAHGSLDEALELWQTGSARLAELDDDDDRLERLHAERDAARAALDDAAHALTSARTEAAGRLGAAVTDELHALAMPDARLEVAVREGGESTHGRDDVAILLAPHPGAEPRSVAKSASGGELSRVMLAIEVVIAGTDPVPTFVFDEVDAGIGGAAAIEVGRRLARLAETSQVIAVTHLAQVAAFASNHLSVVKANDGAVTASSVRRLEGEDREAEMARLLSGLTDSDAAITHARELLSLAV